MLCNAEQKCKTKLDIHTVFQKVHLASNLLSVISDSFKPGE